MNEDIKMICFDLDGTLITSNSWVRLNIAMGLTEAEDMEMYTSYINGTLTYEDWQAKLTFLYKERGFATKDNMTKALLGYEYNRGAKEVIEYLKNKGYKLALLSGSPDVLVEHIAKDLGFDFYNSHNKFVFDSNGNFENIILTGDEGIGKLKILKEISEQNNIPMNAIVCIGDGGNEKEIFIATGKGVTFKGSKIENIAWKVIDNLLNVLNVL